MCLELTANYRILSLKRTKNIELIFLIATYKEKKLLFIPGLVRGKN